jgi:DNA-binding transcriptional regulator YiaG
MSEYHYTDSGLRNIWLASGFEVVETNYGKGVAIHDVEGLHRAIGETLAKKAWLTGAEVRFLRKEMDMSQRALGNLLGNTDQAIAKWEKLGKVPKTADRMIRLIYLEHIGGSVPIRQTIERINDTDRHEQDRMTAEESESGWRIAA